MSRPRPPASGLFRPKAADARPLTSERIADDLRTFERAGGHIEVLGVTAVLKKLGPESAAPETVVPTPARPGAGRRGGHR